MSKTRAELEYDVAYWKAYALVHKHYYRLARKDFINLKQRVRRVNNKRIRACLIKVKYASHIEAQSMAVYEGDKFVYKCKFCSGYHLTTKR